GAREISEMVKIAQNWKDLDGIHFREVTIDSRVLDDIQNFHRLHYFSLQDANSTGSQLAGYAFLRHLTALEVRAMKDVDPVIKAVSDSKELHDLQLDKTAPSPGALAALSKCPQLVNLSLD